MLPNSNSDPAATPAAQPTPPTAPAADPSSETVTITRGELEKYKSYEGRVPSLQRENEALKKQVAPQGQDNTQRLLERAHALGAQGKSLDEASVLIQGEQTDQQFRENVRFIAETLRSGGTLPAGTGSAQGVDLNQVLADYRLDPKDTFVAAQLNGKTFATQAEAELEVARIFRDKALAPNPTKAQEPSTPGGAPPSGMTPQDVEQKSVRLQRLYDNYTQNEPEIKALEAELKEHWANNQ